MNQHSYPAFGILLVDDEPAWLKSLTLTLKSCGGLSNISTCQDSREVMGLLEQGGIGLVLLDLTMPHMDGEQTFAELQRLRPDVRVVLMSGFNAQEALMRFPGKGFASFLQKPFTLDALRSTLREVLEGKAPATK